VEHICIYLSKFSFASKEDYMRVQNFPLSIIGIAFVWFTSLPQYTVGLWSQLEEQFYDFFGKTNEKRPIIVESSAKRGLLVGMKGRIDSDVSKYLVAKVENHNSFSELVISHKTSLGKEKHEKHKRTARLDFSGAKGVIHVSNDYYIIHGDQAPTSNKGALSACPESAKLTLKLAKPIPTYSKSARPTPQLAKPSPLLPMSQLG
jgi:hypothetical protein